ncbi:MAG: malate dehydrogenase [Haloarculaceae archaeon]
MTIGIIGGGGTIGATTANALATAFGRDVRLIDVDIDAARAHATEITHAGAHGAHALGAAHGPCGEVTAVEPGPGAAEGTDCLVVTASIPRPGDVTEGRMAYLEGNREVMDDVARWLGDAEPRPVVVVSNPMDRMAYRLWKGLGWDRSYIVGYALSETARVADELARLRDCHPTEVYCPVLGEHGDYIVPLFSRATAAGEPVAVTDDERQQVLDYANTVAVDIIQQRGGESSRWVTGRGVALVVEAIRSGGVADPVGLSTPLAGEYGYEDVCLAVPVTLSEDGIDEIHEWELDEWERDRLDAAAELVGDSPV